ncbi:MAG: DEAD/DEAH box helicase [Myxococcota bacterium]
MSTPLFPKRNLDDVLHGLLEGKSAPHVTGHFTRPSREAEFGTFPEDLHPRLREALRRRGIERPYRHQARAIEATLAGHHVVLTTPTASGKTLCYNAPVLDRILREPDARALYVFPTKALSQDQYTGLHGLIEAVGEDIGTHTFDGDTPPDARRAVRDHGQVVITNPDMLHAGILPQHTKWLKLFENLRYVVIDELHTYRGIFGSHVSHVLRRLRRICNFYGSDPQFVCCSATIANPMQLAKTLTGLDFTPVERSGAPVGEHHLVCYNPPVVNRQLGIRAGVVKTSFRLAADLIKSGVSTIVFAGSRLHVEVILKYLREDLARNQLSPDLVQGYRGGYLPLHRRRIEAGLRSGAVQGVVATNALELGIDIGSLQACIIAGYPGSIASLWQQSGRAGRRSDKALTVWVARSSALDQYLVSHPDTLMGSSPEHARANPRNLFVLVDHAKCAAFELPFEPGESYGDLSADETREVLEYLESHGVLHESAGRYHWTERVFPAHQVKLRGLPEENFVVVEMPMDRVLAEVDFRSAHTTLHEHAIYNLDSEQYQVERLDYDNHKAYVRKVEPDYYTTALTYTRVSVLDEEDVRQGAGVSMAHGEVLVSRKVTGFKKIRFHTGENVGYGDVFLPDLEMHTTAFWFTLPDDALASLPFDREAAVDGLVGLCHALHTTATVTLMCAGGDLGRAVGDRSAGVFVPLESMPGQPGPDEPGSDFSPTVFLYDSMPGGVGLADELHKRFHEILPRALDLLRRCRCGGRGCPACLGALPHYDGQAREAALALGERLMRVAGP